MGTQRVAAALRLADYYADGTPKIYMWEQGRVLLALGELAAALRHVATTLDLDVDST